MKPDMDRDRNKIVRGFFNIEIRKHPSFLLGDLRPTNFFIPSENFARNLIGPFDEHKKILDVGCGDGVDSITLAARTNQVWGIDLAERRLGVAYENANKSGNKNRILFMQMDAHELAFKDNSIDLIVGNSILLFLNREQFISECYRVLKSGGRAIFPHESMRKHPLLWFYRLYPTLREREGAANRISLEDIKKMSNYFSSVEHHEFYLFSAILAPIVSRMGQYGVISRFRELIYSFDLAITRKFPKLFEYCWISVIIIKKK